MCPRDYANQKSKKTRSPGYPSIDLSQAISKAKAFYEREKRGSTFTHIACTHWGYKEKSSAGMQVVAALLYFGLFEDDGVGESRTVKLTDIALRIILDTRDKSIERDTLIKEAALKPKIHQQIIEKYPDGLPSDETLRHYLIFELSFNENTVLDFMRELKSTIEFANPYNSDIIIGKSEEINKDIPYANGGDDMLITNPQHSPRPEEKTNQIPSQEDMEKMYKAVHGKSMDSGMTKVVDKRIGDGQVQILVEGEWTKERIERLRAFLDFDKDDWPSLKEKDAQRTKECDSEDA